MPPRFGLKPSRRGVLNALKIFAFLFVTTEIPWDSGVFAVYDGKDVLPFHFREGQDLIAVNCNQTLEFWVEAKAGASTLPRQSKKRKKKGVEMLI